MCHSLSILVPSYIWQRVSSGIAMKHYHVHLFYCLVNRLVHKIWQICEKGSRERPCDYYSLI